MRIVAILGVATLLSWSPASAQLMPVEGRRLGEVEPAERAERQLAELEAIGPSSISEPELLERARLRLDIRQDGAGALADIGEYRNARGVRVAQPAMPPSALLVEASANETLGDWEAAIEDYDAMPTESLEEPVVAHRAVLARIRAGTLSRISEAVSPAIGLSDAQPENGGFSLTAARVLRRGRELRGNAPGAQFADPAGFYELAIADPRTPLVVYVEYADYLQGAGACEDAIAVLQAALSARPETFPPEWRIRLATLRKFVEGEEAGREEFNATIEDIKRHMAVTLPSANLYALKAYCELQMGQEVRARRDAMAAWRIASKTETLGCAESAAPVDLIHCILDQFGPDFLPTQPACE